LSEYAHSSDLRPVFDRVYRTNRWTTAGNGSGPGSALGPEDPLIKGLVRFIRSNAIGRIVDVSCGGMAWWPHVLAETEGIAFHDFDVSHVIVNRNREAFPDRGWRFDVADARTHAFPHADLIVCRQTLNHLWPEDAVAVVNNLRRCARFLAITHDPAIRANPAKADHYPLFDDCTRATRYVRLNLHLDPFSPMPGIAAIPDVDDQRLGIFQGDLPA